MQCSCMNYCELENGPSLALEGQALVQPSQCPGKLVPLPGCERRGKHGLQRAQCAPPVVVSAPPLLSDLGEDAATVDGVGDAPYQALALQPIDQLGNVGP